MKLETNTSTIEILYTYSKSTSEFTLTPYPFLSYSQKPKSIFKLGKIFGKKSTFFDKVDF